MVGINILLIFSTNPTLISTNQLDTTAKKDVSVFYGDAFLLCFFFNDRSVLDLQTYLYFDRRRGISGQDLARYVRRRQSLDCCNQMSR